MILFFDENIPPKVPQALQVLGTCEARHLVDHLPRGTSDEEIFAFLSLQGWILVTQDERIRRNPHQRKALVDAGIGVVILTGRAQRTVDQTMIFMLGIIPKLLPEITKLTPPFILGVTDRQKIEKLG